MRAITSIVADAGPNANHRSDESRAIVLDVTSPDAATTPLS